MATMMFIAMFMAMVVIMVVIMVISTSTSTLAASVMVLPLLVSRFMCSFRSWCSANATPPFSPKSSAGVVRTYLEDKKNAMGCCQK